MPRIVLASLRVMRYNLNLIDDDWNVRSLAMGGTSL
jgi:hypothetical protein